jgi:SPP1 gp7 family putative phage head morphogenesis protein
MSAASDFAAAWKLTPKEAAEYLQRRDPLTLTWSYLDLWQEEHALQFTVSRLTNLDIMGALRDGITASVQGDLSRKDWMKNAKEMLAKAGWWGEREVLDPVTGETVTTRFNPHRLNTIFNTNTRQAYAAGSWERAERNKRSHPYLRYVTKNDGRVRDSHLVWHNVTLPVDDPFWDTHAPLNGYNDRCSLDSMSQADYDKGYVERLVHTDKDGNELVDKDGRPLTTIEIRRQYPKERMYYAKTREPLIKERPDVRLKEWVNRRTGEKVMIPEGIDPGFGYNPGKAGARAKEVQRMISEREKALSLPPAKVQPEANKPRFEPQRTAKAAAKWAVEQNLADYADFTGAKPEVANAWVQGLHETLLEFPELRGLQKFTGTAQAQYRRWYEFQIQRITQESIDQGFAPDLAEQYAKWVVIKPKVEGTAWAHSMDAPEVSGIAVNVKFAKDPAAFNRDLVAMVQNGYHPPGCDTIKSVVDHELAHQLDDLLGLSKDPEIDALYTQLRDTDKIGNEVSRYAAKDIHEFIAEAWAEFRNSASPRTAAATVGRVLGERYRSRFPVTT